MNNLNEIYIFNAARLAVKSIINVASLYPKPGLITPLDTSALDGTDYPTLLNGIMSLFQCFVNCVSVGSDTQAISADDAYTILRSSGQIGTNDALRATRGRLPMKGCVFMTGLLCAAAGKLVAQKRILTPPALALTAGAYVSGICARELYTLEAEGGAGVFTDGEKAYISYGLEGIRGEAEHWTMTMRAVGLLRKLEATQGQMNFRERCIHVLLDVMSQNDDTCLAAHGGITELMRVKEEAGNALKVGGMMTAEGVKAVFDMDKAMRSRGASPKGSAVILACALFILELGSMKLTRSGYDE